MKKSLFILLCFVVLPLSAQGQDTLLEPDRMADDFVQIGYVVAEPGDILYSIVGHACLHLQCPYYGLDYVFSYESEGVADKIFRFLLNDLSMGMVAMPMKDYLQEYRVQGRGVREYQLNLPAEVEIELWRIMDERLAEGMNLKYDYMRRGCAISIVNFVNEAIEAANAEYNRDYAIDYTWNEQFNRTLKEIYYDNSAEGFQRFFAMTLVGGEVDNPHLKNEEKLIIPRELLATWERSTIDGKYLIADDGTELLPSINQYEGNKFTPLHLSIIIFILACVNIFWRQKIIDISLLILQTLFGLLMVWLLISPLPCSEWSWLIIPFNPLPAICWKWRDKWGLYYTVLVLVWSIGMLLAPHRLVEYAHIILAIAFAIVVLTPWLKEKIGIGMHR